jgi:hypothetical protein
LVMSEITILLMSIIVINYREFEMQWKKWIARMLFLVTVVPRYMAMIFNKPVYGV